MTDTIRLDDPGLTPIVESGQALYVVSPQLLRVLSEQPEPAVAGRALGVGRLVEQYASIAEQTPGMAVAFGAPHEAHQPWILYHVVATGGPGAGSAEHWRRVLAEGQTCFGCGWTGMTGNARDLAIYEGTKEPMAHLRAALEIPALPCPECGSALTRPAAWVHTVRSSQR